jgi:hypothetical protein
MEFKYAGNFQRISQCHGSVRNRNIEMSTAQEEMFFQASSLTIPSPDIGHLKRISKSSAIIIFLDSSHFTVEPKVHTSFISPFKKQLASPC